MTEQEPVEPARGRSGPGERRRWRRLAEPIHRAGPAAAEATRPDSRMAIRSRALGLLAGALFAIGTLAIPAPVGAASLQLTTPYPAVAVSPGAKVSFDLTVHTDSVVRVDLRLGPVPSGWSTPVLRGGGYVVDGITSDPKSPPSVRLDVTVPSDAQAKDYPLTVIATAGSLTDTLNLDLRVAQSAGGTVTMTSDFPELKGASSANFSFTLTISNDTAEDLSFGLNTQGPDGWTITATPSGSSQATTATVNAGSSGTINVSAKPADNVAAGSYPITVTATAGDKSVQTQLAVDITGSYSMSMSTPDQRLNASGNAGDTITRSITVTNSGTAPLQGVTFTSTPPTGWTVTFDPKTVDIAPNQTATVNALIKPSGDAVAGDYVVTLGAAETASGASANATEDIRVTIETSPLWGLVGVGLIVVTLGGLGWVFRRYGRR